MYLHTLDYGCREKAITQLKRIGSFPTTIKFPMFDMEYNCIFADKNNPSLIVDIVRMFPLDFYYDEIDEEKKIKLHLHSSFTPKVYEYQNYWDEFFLSEAMNRFRYMISDEIQKTLVPIHKMALYLEPYMKIDAIKESSWIQFKMNLLVYFKDFRS